VSDNDTILQEIRDDVRAMRSEMTGLLVSNATLTEWRKAVEAAQLEGRIRALENRFWWALGLGAGAGGLVSFLTQFLRK